VSASADIYTCEPRFLSARQEARLAFFAGGGASGEENSSANIDVEATSDRSAPGALVW
jgi:hypothetical protein